MISGISRDNSSIFDIMNQPAKKQKDQIENLLQISAAITQLQTQGINAFQQDAQSMIHSQSTNISIQQYSLTINFSQGQDKNSIMNDSQWGPQAMADKILTLAQRLSEIEPGKEELLFNSFKEGYAAAIGEFGTELDISKQTYDLVCAGFESFFNEGTPLSNSIDYLV